MSPGRFGAVCVEPGCPGRNGRFCDGLCLLGMNCVFQSVQASVFLKALDDPAGLFRALGQNRNGLGGVTWMWRVA